MILQSPESAMPEPYKTYVQQRGEAIANILSTVVGNANVQLCPRAITPDERVFLEDKAIIYGVELDDLKLGFKSALYSGAFDSQTTQSGLTAKGIEAAKGYANKQFEIGNGVRLKDPVESDGQGQHTVESIDQLEALFHSINTKRSSGVVLMPHLKTIHHRVSVGYIDLGKAGIFCYVGRENTARHQGSVVYGGTQLVLYPENQIASRDKASQILDLPPELAHMGSKALAAYSRIVRSVGRVSFDIMRGVTDNGTTVTSVIDITPRVGGTTPAEVLAIQALTSYKGLSGMCLAESKLLFEPDKTPVTGTNFIDTKSLVINAEVQNLF